MTLSPASILLLIAVILFLLAAFGIALGNIGVLALGLAFFAGSLLVGRWR